ncbi:MAG: hypothetical protein FWF05_01065 [Oscillospiraceae bacterium]|nr:hypothetical protein [Oscillospiraceae bacterium]
MKRIIVAFLCAALLAAGLTLPAAAARGCDCGQVVQVYMNGFGSALYYDWDTPEQRRAEMAETGELFPGILKLLGSAALSLVTLNTDFFARGVAGMFMGLMGHLQMDEEGRSIENISVGWKIDEEKDHRESPEYTFHFDYRIDPYEAAAQLNDFIEELCKHTGHKKIALTGFSEGANVVMTYLAVYGSKRLETLILGNGAWQGLTLVGELLTKKIALTGESVTNYLGDLPDESGLLAPVMRLLKRTRLLDFTYPLSKWIVSSMGGIIFEEALIPLFGQWPAIWAFVPGEYYAEARKLIADDPKYAYLLGQSDKYHDEVQAEAENLLTKARKDGVKIAIICGYGFAPIIGTETCDYHTDTMIDTARASGGATVAKYGEKLPGGGSDGDSDRLSPDGIIDAGTCMFPDYTWFFKGLRHDSAPSRELRQWIISSEGQPTVRDNEMFPQFIILE